MSARRHPVMLFAGTFWSGSSEAALSTGFRENGWCVQEVDHSSFGVQPSGDLVFRIASRLSRKLVSRQYQKAILAECEALRPDVFFTVKGVDLGAGLLRKIRGMGIRTAIYYPDVEFDHTPDFENCIIEFDTFFTTKSFHIRHLSDIIGAKRVIYVPHGFSPSVHRPVFCATAHEGFVTDVLHAGTYTPYKHKWLEGAASQLPDVSFRLIGNNWRQKVTGETLGKSDMPGLRRGTAYAAAIQSARINVAVHMGSLGSDWADLVSTRTFEIPACRGFMLHIDNDEVREFYEPGVEIDVFGTPAELADKIKFYLARPDLRDKMIERAFQRCVPNYSYNARAQYVSSIMLKDLLQ